MADVKVGNPGSCDRANGVTEQPDSYELVEKLIARFRQLSDEYREAEEEVKEATAMLTATELAHQYESYDEYLVAKHNRKAATLEYCRAVHKKSDLNRGLLDVERRLLPMLSERVWIRFGDVGIGVVVDKWGDRSRYLWVRPWEDKMPSLDRTRRED